MNFAQIAPGVEITADGEIFRIDGLLISRNLFRSFGVNARRGDIFQFLEHRPDDTITVHRFTRGSRVIEPEEGKAPRGPVEVSIQAGGDDWNYVRCTLVNLLSELDERGSLVSMISGGGGGHHSLHVTTREVSAEQYRKELDEWFQVQKLEAPDGSH